MMSLGYYALCVPTARYLINPALSLKGAVWGWASCKFMRLKARYNVEQ